MRKRLRNFTKIANLLILLGFLVPFTSSAVLADCNCGKHTATELRLKVGHKYKYRKMRDDPNAYAFVLYASPIKYTTTATPRFVVVYRRCQDDKLIDATIDWVDEKGKIYNDVDVDYDLIEEIKD